MHILRGRSSGDKRRRSPPRHDRPMEVVRFGLGVRALRRRRGWTQEDLAAKAQVSRTAVWRIERGHADRVTVHVLVRVAAALAARIDVRLLWQGEGLDRLLDAGHADLIERTLELLASADWLVATEVSFNVRGERGSIDILAFHPATGSLVVIEVKSVVPGHAGDARRDRPQRTTCVDHRPRPWMGRDERYTPAGPPRRSHGTASSRAARRDVPNSPSGPNRGGSPLAPAPERDDGRRAVPVRCSPHERSAPGREATTQPSNIPKRDEGSASA